MLTDSHATISIRNTRNPTRILENLSFNFFLENSTRITVAGTCFSIKHPRSDAADEVDHFCKYHSCSLVQMVTTGP